MLPLNIWFVYQNMWFETNSIRIFILNCYFFFHSQTNTDLSIMQPLKLSWYLKENIWLFLSVQLNMASVHCNEAMLYKQKLVHCLNIVLIILSSVWIKSWMVLLYLLFNVIHKMLIISGRNISKRNYLHYLRLYSWEYEFKFIFCIKPIYAYIVSLLFHMEEKLEFRRIVSVE